jgi:DNA-binding MarR family transcriptional regulator
VKGDQRETVLSTLEKWPGLSGRTIARETGIRYEQVEHILHKLRRDEWIVSRFNLAKMHAKQNYLTKFGQENLTQIREQAKRKQFVVELNTIIEGVGRNECTSRKT